jgi:hypothetical protein
MGTLTAALFKQTGKYLFIDTIVDWAKQLDTKSHQEVKTFILLHFFGPFWGQCASHKNKVTNK